MFLTKKTNSFILLEIIGLFCVDIWNLINVLFCTNMWRLILYPLQKLTAPLAILFSLFKYNLNLFNFEHKTFYFFRICDFI